MGMRKLYSGTIVFEVPYEGNHDLIDSQCGDPAMYDGSGVPRAVVDRSISAVESAYVKLGRTPEDSEIRSIDENALKGEFGDARLVSDTIPYGVVIG